MLTLTILLTSMSGDYCQLRSQGHNQVKSTLIAFHRAQQQHDPKEVEKILLETNGLGTMAVAVAATRCPQHL